MTRALGEDELIETAPGRQPPRHQVPDPGHRAGPGGRPRPARRRRVLHRHQPGRPGRRRQAAAWRCSTRPSPTPAPSWSWRSPRSSRWPGACRRRTSKMHEGVWDKSAKGAHEVRGRKLGIVGYGNIGTQLSVIAESLGMSVYFYDIADKLAIGNARRCSTPAGAARVGGDRHAARGRPGRQPRVLRRGRVRPDAAAVAVPQPVPRLRRRPRRAAQAHRVRAHRGRGHRRLPEASRRANGEEFVSELRGLPQRHPHPAHRRLHRGGAAGHRRVRVRQAGRLRRRRRHRDVGQPAERRAAGRPRARTASSTCTRTSPACSPRSTGCSPTTA